MTPVDNPETPGVARRVQDASDQSGNRPERAEWFQEQALGLFVHWNIDSQLGSVISHSMVGASQDYLKRYTTELPKTFYPNKFDPDDWARLARIAGVRYVVFTTKHHSGFCMFHTRTTDFNIANTPYGKDITGQIVKAFRAHGIAIGFYFSPDDFWLLHRQGQHVSRQRPEASPLNNPELMAHNQAQVRELLTNYGPIDVFFFDGEAEGLKQLVWEMQPDALVTRGAMATPEQQIPDAPMPGPWEACFTLGTQWAYKPTNEDYKSGTKLIEMLIETRAKGGNLLLNVGPMASGELPLAQTDRMQELALWLFANHESIYDVRPLQTIREPLAHGQTAWFLQSTKQNAVYALITGAVWPKGERRTITLKTIRAGQDTKIELLGQSGHVLEYRPNVDPKVSWYQDDRGVHVLAMRAQRLYNNSQWPNPVVLKMTNVTRAS